MSKKIYLSWVFIALGMQTLFAQNFWKKTNLNERNVIESKKNIGLDYSNAYSLDIDQLKAQLKKAPKSETGMQIASNVIIDIPLLDGSFEKYFIYETSNMAPELAARFPEIKSFRGVSLKNDANTISFGISQRGIKLILFSKDKKPVVIEPVTADASVYLVSPAVPDFLPLENKDLGCTTEGNALMQKNVNFVTDNTDDRKFRTFRLAVTTDGQFSTYHGGTISSVLSAVNDLMSYINPVYERDLSIHMNLISNTDTLFYLDASTDPYTTATALNNETQSTLTSVIGEANYDIGILFTNQTGGGNAGKIASVCQDSQGTVNGSVDKKKGSAYAGPVTTGPIGFIYAMIVAHEMGHQYGANHTFSRPENVTYGSIFIPESGANREPGSGTTIMGYPGVTGGYDVADKHSDQFLHYSISQINNYIKTTSCATVVNMTNNPPVVNAGSDFTIPKGTAFKLTAIGSDPDNNNLTYSWEEADISAPNSPQVIFGSYTYPNSTSTTNPNFRVYPPVSSPTRYLPPLKEVLDGSLYNTWNMVSDVTRSMKFISLVRDNATGGGQTAADEMTVNIDSNIGPFKITSISLNQNYPSGSSHLLKWDVNGTNAAPTNTQSVNILISTDGGNTFSTLVSNTANDGEENITIPTTPSPKAYIIVESIGNIYYAASPAFAINHTVSLSCNQYPADGTFAVAPNAPANININIPATNNIEDINILIDASYTNLKDLAFTIKSPTDQQNQIFWYGNCPGMSVLKATFDQEGQSLPMNCNNLNATPNVRVEPIRLDLSRYYGQAPNGNWSIRAVDITTNSTSSGTVNAAAIELCTREASILSVQDIKLEQDDFQIYPNPSNGNFNILMKNNVPATIQVFDISGKLVHTQTNVDNNTKINLSSFPKGNYIVVLQKNDIKKAKKIIIK